MKNTLLFLRSVYTSSHILTAYFFRVNSSLLKMSFRAYLATRQM